MDFSFFIVDDRELDCYIAEKIIEKTQRSYERRSFHEANACLDHIKSREFSNNITVILLDIMMPIMNGFEFLDAFEALSEDMKSQYRVVPITTL
ncbi:response regulator [Pseudopedobacter beijingensis]|uniref:Response regulator n=1 Tax=Pseudopedobacter beijingensis TaxID=1207056 RepID=A0ABW4IAW3_9SPHI